MNKLVQQNRKGSNFAAIFCHFTGSVIFISLFVLYSLFSHMLIFSDVTHNFFTQFFIVGHNDFQSPIAIIVLVLLFSLFYSLALFNLCFLSLVTSTVPRTWWKFNNYWMELNPYIYYYLMGLTWGFWCNITYLGKVNERIKIWRGEEFCLENKKAVFSVDLSQTRTADWKQ